MEATKTGKGRVVEIAMAEVAFPTLASSGDGYYKTGSATRTGNEHASGTQVPYNVYRCHDEPDGSASFFAIILMSPRHWPQLCQAMNRPDLVDDERFNTNGRRVRNKRVLEAEILAWTMQHRRGQLAAMAKAAGFPGASVRNLEEVVHDEHLHERGFLEWQDHPDERLDPQFGGKVAAHRSPLRFWGSEMAPLELQRGGIDSDRVEVEADWLGAPLGRRKQQ